MRKKKFILFAALVAAIAIFSIAILNTKNIFQAICCTGFWITLATYATIVRNN